MPTPKPKSIKDLKAAETTAKGTIKAAKIAGGCGIVAAVITGSFLYLKNSREAGSKSPVNSNSFNNTQTTSGNFNNSTFNAPVNISESFNSTVNNFESRKTYVAPMETTLDALRKQAAAFRDSHPGTRISVEAETGSVAREQVGQALGAVLDAERVGSWQGGVKIGIATGAAVSILHAPGQEAVARDVAKVFEGYLKASAALQTSRRQASNSFRVYLYGTPTFATNDVVTIE